MGITRTALPFRPFYWGPNLKSLPCSTEMKIINSPIGHLTPRAPFICFIYSVFCFFFYFDNNELNNGEKISTLSDKKIALPSYDAIQNTESRKPTADDDLNFSYMNYRAQQCLTV